MSRHWLRLFGVVAVVELIGVGLDWTAVQWLAKPLLAPLLLAYLVGVRRRVDPVAVGLVAATAGDIALLVPGQPAFLVGMGCFLITQLAFGTRWFCIFSSSWSLLHRTTTAARADPRAGREECRG